MATIGGGYAMIPIIQDEIVNRKRWILEEEFIDILSVAQTTPGPIAVNTSVFVGYQTSGKKITSLQSKTFTLSIDLHAYRQVPWPFAKL